MKTLFKTVIIISLIVFGILPLCAEEQGMEGINKNQPVSPGQIIYKGESPKETTSRLPINTYFFNGIDRNKVEIRSCKGSPPILDIQNLSLAELNEKCDFETLPLYQGRVLFDVYDYLDACGYLEDGVICHRGHKTLLIRVIEDSDKILINEIKIKPVPGLVYEKEYFKKTFERNIHIKE